MIKDKPYYKCVDCGKWKNGEIEGEFNRFRGMCPECTMKYNAYRDRIINNEK